MIKMKYKLLFTIIIFISLLILPLPVSAIWSDKLNVIHSKINNVNTTVLSLNITNLTGTNNATHVYFNGNVNRNFTGINITKNNVSEVPFYLQYNFSTDSNKATIWVNVSSFTNVTDDVGLWYNEGKVGVSVGSASNGTTTFPFFCDFSIDNCGMTRDTGSTDTPVVSGGVLAFTGGTANGDGFSWANSTQTLPVIYEISIRRISAVTTVVPVIWRPDIGTFYRYFRWYNNNLTWLPDSGITPDFTQAQTMTRYQWYNYRIDFITQDQIDVWLNNTKVISSGNPSNTFTSIQAGIGADALANVEFDNVHIRKYTPQTAWTGWSIGIINSWNNSYTNNSNLTLSKLSSSFIINFTINTSGNNISYYNWTVNNIDQSNNASFFNWLSNTAGTYTINGTANNPIINQIVSWNVTINNYTLELLTPTNGSTSISTPVTLIWRQWPTTTPHTWQISTDNQFLNIIASGIATSTTESFSTSLSLNSGTTYYWHAKNSTGSYSNWFNFTTSTLTPTPGRLNITVFDEQQWDNRIMNFSAQLYNSTTALNKSTTTGWVNYTSNEISSGTYLVRIVPNSSYASRNVLATSPTNVTVWIPSTSNTINTIAFYLMDYTTLYPWSSSILSVTKNNSVMHSSYFDADAKVAVYLIQGDSYGITITNNNNMNNWGNYIAISSGNVEIVITNIAVNATSAKPFSDKLEFIHT